MTREPGDAKGAYPLSDHPDELRVEWGVLRPSGSVAGPMWWSEALKFLGSVPGGALVRREVHYTPWVAPAASDDSGSSGGAE